MPRWPCSKRLGAWIPAPRPGAQSRAGPEPPHQEETEPLTGPGGASGLSRRAILAAQKAAPAAGLTLSLCMIVRDEEEMLPRCLATIAPVVDEIIVVDTGSA